MVRTMMISAAPVAATGTSASTNIAAFLFRLLFLHRLFVTVIPKVSGECLDPSTHSITEGAWDYVGVNGTWVEPPRYDENNVNTHDPTWTVPNGDWNYPHGEMGSYGENYLTQHTCSILQFCNPEGGGSNSSSSKEEDEADDDDENLSKEEGEENDKVWGCYRGGVCGENTHGCCDCSFATKEECDESGKDWDTKPIWSDGCGGICKRRRRRRGLVAATTTIDENSRQEIYKLTDKTAFNDCDFTNATLIGATSAATCVEIRVDDLTAEGGKSYYSSSRENCLEGQKVAVVIADWESTSSQCAAIATHVPASDRVRGCDCGFTKKPFAARYGGLCAYSYREACFGVSMPDDSDCCDAETCPSKMELFDTPEGKSYELERREDCDDDIPGNCYNADGGASDLSRDGSTDCCTQTCSSCGSELAPGAVWETCTSNDPANMTARCGRLSRYAQDDFVCDFKDCPPDSHWGSKNAHVYEYMGVKLPVLWTPVTDGDNGGGVGGVAIQSEPSSEEEGDDYSSAASPSAGKFFLATFAMFGGTFLLNWMILQGASHDSSHASVIVVATTTVSILGMVFVLNRVSL